MSTLRATYRIQFTPEFGFRALHEQLSYLRHLGVSHIYASPVFGARPGSAHGYDVIAPDRMNGELGSPKEFDDVLDAARTEGLGWIQDIVPNHMAFDHRNAMLMDVLEHGEASPYYRVFDIEWNHVSIDMKGKLLAPILGRFFGECLEAGELQLHYESGGFRVRYYDHVFPIKPASYVDILTPRLGNLEVELGRAHRDFQQLAELIQGFRTLPSVQLSREWLNQVGFLKLQLAQLVAASEPIRAFIAATLEVFNGRPGDPDSFDRLEALLGDQLYRLAFWKVATEEINYRRFFNVNQLIAVRVEDEQVFRATHAFVLSLLWQKRIDGLRIDHIDGLYDPAAYLRRLREAAPEAIIVVEKILDAEEALPPTWPVQGTTGYDFLNMVNGILCDRANDHAIERAYFRFIGSVVPYDALVSAKKRQFLGRHMAGDIDRLANRLRAISHRDRHARDFTLYGLRRALVELLTFFPVYRTYVSATSFDETDRRYIEQAIQRAIDSEPALTLELQFIERFLKLQYGPHTGMEDRTQVLDFVMSFQQLTGPLMAKGLEDTALYVYAKLLSLNDVGGNARKVGVSPVEFHFFNKRRAQQAPTSFNATSTHDTKRGEDVRARISVLSEMPQEWSQHVTLWRRINKGGKRASPAGDIPDANDEYFFYQTLVGSWPVDGVLDRDYLRRLQEYAIKAVREAKVHTAWLRPDEVYEQGYLQFIDQILTPIGENPFLADFLPFQKRVAWYGFLNSLSQTALKATCPGVPDFYQGTELWDLHLVDPDNRQAVDYRLRRRMLDDLEEAEQADRHGLLGQLLSNLPDGRAKLYLVRSLLRCRAEHPLLFAQGDYVPLSVRGRHRDSVIAFARRAGNASAVILVPRLLHSVVPPGVVPLGMEIWKDTTVALPPGGGTEWHDVVSGESVHDEDETRIGNVFRLFPIAVLVR